jgi:hypothetical protein
MELKSGEYIPPARADCKLIYLGTEILPWKGIDINSLEEEFLVALMRTKRLALKPHQKTALISAYLVPHFLNRLSMAVPPISILRRLDQELRVLIKDIFHLPQSTANGLLCCGKRDGGLGIRTLESLIVSTSLTIGYKFLQNPDPIIQALAVEANLEKRLESLANNN